MIVIGSGVVLRSGKNPFELFMLAWATLAGLVGLLVPESQSSAVVRLLPGWATVAWYGGLAIGGAVSLTGVWLPGLTSLLVERVGLIALGGFSLLYSAGVVVVAGARGMTTVLIVGAFAGACWWRFGAIWRDLHRAETEIARLRSEADGGD